MFNSEERKKAKLNKQIKKSLGEKEIVNARYVANKYIKLNKKEKREAKLGLSKHRKADAVSYKINHLIIDGLKYGFWFIFVIFSMYVCFASLYKTETKEAINRMVEVMHNKSIDLYDDYINDMRSLEYEENAQKIKKILSGDSSNMYTNLRKTLMEIVHYDRLYFMHEDDLISMDNNSYKYILDNNEIYSVFEKARLSEENLYVSDWVYNGYLGKYTKVLTYKIKNSNDNLIGIVGIEINPYAKDNVFYKFSTTIENLNLIVLSGTKEIYKNTNLFDIEEIYNLYSKEFKKIEVDDTLKKKSDKTKENDNLEKNKVVKNENVYDGLYENIGGQIFDIFSSMSLGIKKNKIIIKRFDELDAVFVIEFGDLYSIGLRHLGFLTGCVFMLVLLISYMVTINKKDEGTTSKYVGVLYIVGIVIETIIMTVIYTNIINDIRNKEIISNGLLLNTQVKTEMNIEKNIESVLSTLNSQLDSSLEYVENVMKNYIENTSLYEVKSSIIGLDNAEGKYRDNYDIINNKLSTNGTVFSNIDEENNQIVCTNIFTIKKDDSEYLYQVEYVIKSKVFDTEITKNQIVPKQYVEVGNIIYYLSERKIKEENKIKFDNLSLIDDNLYINNNKRRTVLCMCEEMFGNDYYVLYNNRTLRSEIFFKLLAYAICIIGIVFNCELFKTRENQYRVNENLTAIYGETIFMKPSELEKAYNLEIEKKNMNNQVEFVGEDVSNIFVSRRKQKNLEILSKKNYDDEFNSLDNKKAGIKILNVFKSNKEIFSEFIRLQYEDMKRQQKGKHDRLEQMTERKQEESSNAIEKIITTLGEALDKLEEKREIRKNNKTLTDSFRESLKEKTINERKTESATKSINYSKFLADKYKDAKK